MKRDTNHRAPRRPNCDYSQIGRYFVTICTQHRHHLLGVVNDGRMTASTTLKNLPTQSP